ncbi:TPA: rhodanese-like domain-containing protein [Candidatus Nomurabacteria bacterium]|nr:MAG: Rhodanese-related sulfurtransferase [Parcubacteria bacterium RAAC4_OD1_1]HCY26147.1 rhodanese-like domain-containing protein [Candidatus Nomurabacteria bacterium]
MKKNKYIIIFTGVVLIGVAFVFFNSQKCSGAECEVKEMRVEKYDIYNEMNPETLPTKVLNGEVVLLDVREDSEWSDGHIEGALHLPLGEINEESVINLPKDKEIYIYCRSGRRAGEAETILKSLGFSNVLNIGGINHFVERGGKLVK